eukprot:237578-Prorocentrum_minimum.AAC.1
MFFNVLIQRMGDDYKRNVEQNVGDAINLLPKLATRCCAGNRQQSRITLPPRRQYLGHSLAIRTDVLLTVLGGGVQGLDVNVRFENIDDFEFTEHLAIFDLLDIQLVHGWLVSPEVTSFALCPRAKWLPIVPDECAKVIGSKSYNELITIVCSSAPPVQPDSSADLPPAADTQTVIKDTTDDIALSFGDLDLDQKDDQDQEEENKRELLKALTMSLEGDPGESIPQTRITNMLSSPL